MRLIKMFGLSVIAVGAFMAFVGVSSAMAVTPLEEVVLCKTDPALPATKCPAHFGPNTLIHAELVAGTHATLLSSLGNVLCEESRALGETTTLLAHGLIKEAEFKLCTLGAVSCTVTVEDLPYLFKGELKPTDSEYEVLLTEHPTELKGQPQAQVVCGTVLNCKYGAANILLEAELTANDTVLSVLQALTGVGPLCGAANPVWHAKYLTRCLEGGNQVGCWLRME